MLPEPAPKLPPDEILHLIEEARNAELCRDTKSLRKILKPVWNIEETPNFDNYDNAIKAELFRLGGVFLSFNGIAENKKNTQLRGKDLLTNAVEIFEANKNLDKATEAKINLAFCYWNIGKIDECEAILNMDEADLRANPLHPVFLQIKINRMMFLCWCERFDEALAIVKEISPSMNYCTNLRLQIMFHIETGILLHRKLDYKSAVFHFSESIRLTKNNGNFNLLALTYNNLSLLYRDMKRFDEAHDLSTKSFGILKKLNHIGWMPHILDSKALIYLDENKYEEALEAIEEALTYFYEGEDYKGLTAALWTKVSCLIRLERTEEAFVIYGELYQIAAERIGEVATRKFAKKLSEEVYGFRHLTLADELARVKKAHFSAALISSGGKIGEAAKILGLKNHQTLSGILNKQFPELLGELGFKRRARRTTEKPSPATESKSAETSSQGKIYRMILTDRDFTFDFKLSSPQFEVFYFNKYIMQWFGINSAAIVAVVAVKELKAGMAVLIIEKDKFMVGKAEYDEWVGIYYMLDEEGNPLPVNEENIAGEVIGFCPFAKSGNQYIQFSRLSF